MDDNQVRTLGIAGGGAALLVALALAFVGDERSSGEPEPAVDPPAVVTTVNPTPSVGACCYEVGPEVRVAFATAGWPLDALARWFVAAPVADAGNPPMPGLAGEARPGHAFFDGWTCAQEQVRSAGVPAAQIYGAGLCTASHAVLCSYRRDGAEAGRIAGAIMPVSPS